MLMEVSVVEQRYQAVLEVIRDGTSIVDIAARMGVSRQSVHSWLSRYRDGGLDALKDRSHRPVSCPHQMTPIVEARIVELRRLHPGWGPRRLMHQLGRDGVDQPPSYAAVYRCLVRHRLIEPRKRRRRDDYVRWERGRAMELWQMDVMSGVLLDDGTDLKVVTGIDDHSRFCVVAQLVTRPTSRAVCGALAQTIEHHGVPDEILTDNGKVFTGRFGPNPHESLFDRICRDNGIRHLLTGIRSPTTTGKIERFHRTMREEHLRGRTFASVSTAQTELDAWVSDYNTERPHQSLAMLTPAERFRLGESTAAASLPPDTSALDTDRNGDDWVSRKVTTNGVISVAWQSINVGRNFFGKRVDVHVGPKLLEVWCGAELVKTVVRTSSKEVRKKNAEGTRSRGAGIRIGDRRRKPSPETVLSGIR